MSTPVAETESVGDEEEEEEVPQIDPVTLKPDLYAAAACNDTEKVAEFLELQVPATFIDERNGWTTLHWAAVNGNAKLLKLLLKNGASEPYHRLVAKAKKLRSIQMGEQNADKKSYKQPNNKTDPDETSMEEKFGEHNDEENAEEDGDSAGDENEEDEDEDIDKALETSVDLTKNTPLLWAVNNANLRCVWLLLADGYSPNDIDSAGNNAVHLGALGGDTKLMKVLIDDGGSANMVNIYKNHAIDMAKNKEIRDLVAAAQVAGASMTEADIGAKHEKNLNQYYKYVNLLNEAVAEAQHVNSIHFLQTFNQASSDKIASTLAEGIKVGKEWCLDPETIAEAEQLLSKLESSQELMQDITSLQQHTPIRTQTEYISRVYKLQQSMTAAEGAGLDKSQLQVGHELISKCQIEYWLSTLLHRLADVETADDSHEHDMTRLRQAIHKAQACKAAGDLINQGLTFMKRLDAELGMSRAIEAIPKVKMPMADPPEGYFEEVVDKGFVIQTEEYPLPPLDPATGKGGDYHWKEAESFLALKAAFEVLSKVSDVAGDFGANPHICDMAKSTLVRVQKEIKLLEDKDAADKVLAVEVVKKLAKKMKKGKKKG